MENCGVDPIKELNTEPRPQHLEGGPASSRNVSDLDCHHLHNKLKLSKAARCRGLSLNVMLL